MSAWHDVPLYAGDGLLHFVCEIPKETSAKMELATDEPRNPIKQDTKKGKIRFYPYNINWNYGMLPQTWEDPAHKNADCFDCGVSYVLVTTSPCLLACVHSMWKWRHSIFYGETHGNSPNERTCQSHTFFSDPPVGTSRHSAILRGCRSVTPATWNVPFQKRHYAFFYAFFPLLIMLSPTIFNPYFLRLFF